MGAYFDAILAVQHSNTWTRRDWTRVPRLLRRWRLSERVAYRVSRNLYHVRNMFANRCVVKEIRANLMLDWLATYTGGRIVFLIRHPCAAIGSRMKQRDPNFDADMTEILCQSELMRDFLEPFRERIRSSVTPLRRHTILWCVENFVPLCQAKSRDWLVCCYEDFLTDRDGAFERIFKYADLEPSFSTKWEKKRLVSNPTHDSGLPRPWHAPLSEAEGEEVLEVCEEFGIQLYGRRPFPLDIARVPALHAI